jgi:hypothetical protein
MAPLSVSMQGQSVTSGGMLAILDIVQKKKISKQLFQSL